MKKDQAMCGKATVEAQRTPLEMFTQRIETLSDRSNHMENSLNEVYLRLLGNVERESALDRAAPPESGGGEYNNLNYAISTLADRLDDMESLIQSIQERF